MRARKRMLDDIWQGALISPVFLLHQKVSSEYKTCNIGSVAKDKAPSPRSAVPEVWWAGHVRAGKGTLYELQSHRTSHLPEPVWVTSLPTAWSPHGHFTQLLIILQRQPAEHLDHLVLVNTTGRETEAPEAAPLPPVREGESEMARTSHVARKSHSCGHTVSPCYTTQLQFSVFYQGRGARLLF